jgi:hypothetical protein
LSWHDGERGTVIGGIIVSAIFLTLYIFLVPIMWDFATLRTFKGLPLAADFSNYWAASKLTLAGHPALAYNVNDLHGLQQQLLGAHHRNLSGFYYPPIFLFMVFPLGLLPYVYSFIIWIAITLIVYMMILTRISNHPIMIPLILIFPGTYENFIFGQNAFLSGSMLGGGLLLLDRWPLLAGCLFGLLCYKPQFVLIVLFALLVGRYWKAFIATIASSLLVVFSSVIVFGSKTWVAYFTVMSMPMKLLESGYAAWNIMPTFFAATLAAGFNVQAAYVVQGIVSLAALSGVAWVWVKKTNLAVRGAVLTLGLLLYTPYAFIYELALLALPLCWIWEDGRVRGRLPGELVLLLVCWMMPFIMQLLWGKVNVLYGKLQVGPLVLLTLFLFILTKEKIQRWRTGNFGLEEEKG